MVGLAHAVLHWPLILLPGQVLNEIPLLAHSAWLIAEAVLIAWIFVHTQGSVLMATLYHCLSNTLLFLYAGIDSPGVHWLRAAISVSMALVVVLMTGPALTRGPGTEARPGVPVR